jgi:hypothetical protein
MPTAFRSTATLPDRSGKYRTSLVPCGRDYYGPVKGAMPQWSAEAIDSHCSRQGIPTVGVELTEAEWLALEADNALRFGYADKPGDTATPFTPTPWIIGF